MTFHWYGFLVGIAVVVGYSVTEHKAVQVGVPRAFLSRVLLILLLAGFIAARLWHLATDFPLYQGKSVLDMFAVWQGGMSIVGALGGASMTWYCLYLKWPAKRQSLIQILDALAWGLPVGQIIGRVANYVNHELFGVPTTVAWGIFVPFEHRPIEYQNASYFHPLFAYEMVCMLVFVGFLLYKKIKHAPLQPGQQFLCYILWYSTIRFFLDFLRIDVGTQSGLGYNQLVLIGVIVLASALYWNIYASRTAQK